METTLCGCHSSCHQILTEYDPEYNHVYLEIHLTTHRNFFKRIWVAVKYIFGYKSNYGAWDNFIVDKKNKESLLKELIKIKD